MSEHSRWFGAFQTLVGEVTAEVPVRERLAYEAARMIEAHRAGEVASTAPIRFYVPGLRDATVADILAHSLTEAEARAAIAQLYIFDSWEAVQSATSTVDPAFERAVDAVVTGDLAALRTLVEDAPELVRARSAYGHRSTLLHYVSANGVEIRRQRTPDNIVEVTNFLISAGAEVDATSGSYGSGAHNTPLCLTLSSGHPAEAGVQVELAGALLDGGAALEGTEGDGMPLTMALAFGYTDTAEALVARGARIGNVVVAAGLGRDDVLRSLLEAPLAPYVDPFGRRITDRTALLDRALLQAARPALAAIGRLLLESGANPNASWEHDRTAMHWAAYAGGTDFVELLLSHGGDPRVVDSYYGSTPDVWAREGGHPALADRILAAAEGSGS